MYEVFEQLLQKHGITSYKVAKETGVTQTALSNWKSGRSTPTTKTLQKIADYFGVTIDYLMNGIEESEKQEFNAVFSKRLRYYLDKYQMTQVELAKRLGVGTTSVYNWCNGIKTPRMDKVDIMCDLFHCNRSDLVEEKPLNTLTPKDERDIAKDLDALMDKIKTGEDSPLYFNGDEVDEESMELLRHAIGMSLRHLKIVNKEKYNPRKNKK